MSIQGSDPFDTLIYQQGQIGAPLVEGGARGADDLDTAQRSVTIGDVIPIVFGRRIGTIGGVLISPGATEARFENNVTNEVTASYHLVLSEGQIQPIQVRDVFQRSCRVGAFTQSYNRRAGAWAAGNVIVDRGGSYVKPECPYYTGTGGTYQGMSTGSHIIADVPDGDTRWDRQVHLFVRGGMYVTRLLDDTLGPSNNICDLLLWLIRNTSRTPSQLIDVPAFEDAAIFTDGLGLWCNGEFSESSNLEDFLANNARYFLLSKTKRNGKVGVRPLLPVTSTGALDVSPIRPSYLFYERWIVPGSFEMTYVPLNERKPFVALMLWRQQPEDDIGIIRTTEVRYANTAPDGPFEQHDLSVFATSENHVVKVGAYIQARRRYVTHHLRIKVRPAAFNASMAAGDIVEVRLQRLASSAVAGVHQFFYEVDRIGKPRSGEVTLDLVHFPVDSLGRSLVALDVAAAVGSGTLLSTGKTGTSCDVNADDDETPAADDGQDLSGLPGDDAFDVDIDGNDEFGTGGDADDGFGGGGGRSSRDEVPETTFEMGSPTNSGNPLGESEIFDDQEPPSPHPTSPGDEVPRPGVGLDPLAGGPASGCPDCVPQEIRWYRDNELVATIDYPGGEPRVSAAGYVFGSGRKVPAWLGGIGAGVLLVAPEDVGLPYRSEVDCADGCSFSNTTIVEPGQFSRNYSVSWSGTGTAGPPVTSVNVPGYSTEEFFPDSGNTRWRVWARTSGNEFHVIVSSTLTPPGLLDVTNTPI